MQNNFYTLRILVQELAENLQDLVLAECYSQNKDELILGFCKSEKLERKERQFYIRATLQPAFSCLSFPSELSRSLKNNVDLFPKIIGKRIKAVQIIENDRAFYLEFKEEYKLLFTFFGRQPNLILIQEEKVIAVFNQKYKTDFSLDFSKLGRKISRTEEDFRKNKDNLRVLFPTFGKELLDELETLLKQKDDWCVLKEFENHLHNPFFLVNKESIPPQFLIKKRPEINQFCSKSALEALNEFYKNYQIYYVFEREKTLKINELIKQKTAIQKTIKLIEEKRKTFDLKIKNEELAHILMANLSLIPKYSEFVELFDFYRNTQLKISLKPHLSPQKNAERYYQKAKNEGIELQNIEENSTKKRDLIEKLEEKIAEISKISSLKQLKKYNKSEIESKFPSGILVEEIHSFEIFIGKNARANEWLLTQFSKKNDWWFHVRQGAGSHVIIKYKNAQMPPTKVIERAAELAAFYSNQKNDSLVSVVLSQRKYIRKAKKLEAGQVLIDKELQTILVKPKKNN